MMSGRPEKKKKSDVLEMDGSVAPQTLTLAVCTFHGVAVPLNDWLLFKWYISGLLAHGSFARSNSRFMPPQPLPSVLILHLGVCHDAV